MFQALIAEYMILIVALIICIAIVRKGNVNDEHRVRIVTLIGLGIPTAASYAASILVPQSMPALAAFLSGLYYMGTDWLALALMMFVAEFTHIHPRSALPRRLLYTLAGIDSISFVINTFTGHMFTMYIGNVFGAEHWQVRFNTPYFVHLAFAYLMVMYSVVLLAYRFAVAPKIYKNKYGVVLVFAALTVVLNVACVALRAKFDYSVLVYGLIAISICYYVLYAAPRTLLENMNSTMVEDSVIGLFVYDEDNYCVGVNQTAKDLFDGQGDIFTVAEEYLAKWEEQYHGELKNAMSVERTIVRGGETKYIRVNYQKLLDKKGRVLGSGFQFEDRTEAVRQYQEEKYRVTHDLLTGIWNRETFEKRANEILARMDEPYYIICTNIKDFKLINELCGTETGDALLKAQADMIRKEVYGNSVSARIYADRFCTLLPKRYFSEERFKESMLGVMDSVLSLPIKAHFYFGIYEIVDPMEPVWAMFDKAMMAIDAIRGSYEQYFSYYREDMFQRVLKEKEIISGFDRAIDEEQFHMYLQPQIANDGTLVGAEALVRWIHPEKGMVSPADFIPALEKSGLIHKLDLYMWEKAAQQLEKWKKEGKENLSISVNISTKDFYLIDIYSAFRDIAQKYDFDIKNLKLEITESALMKDVRKIMKNMDELHALGYDIEIDDFGSGYSSLGMLKDIHADILKIDMIFLRETQNVQRSTTILKNVISMSKELGMPVITEGVETKEQVDFLRDVGCDMFQGYYFAKPMSVASFEEMYSA